MFLCRDWMRPSVTKAVSGGDPCSQIAPLFYHGFLRSVAKSLVHSAAAWPADIKRSFASPSLFPTLPPFIFISSLSLPLWPALWYWHHSGSHKRHVFRGTPGLEVDPLPAIVALSSSPQVVTVQLSSSCTACVHAQSLSCPLFTTPWTGAHQFPLSMGFSRQEYWSGLPFPTSGDLPDPRVEPISHASLALAGGFQLQ